MLAAEVSQSTRRFRDVLVCEKLVLVVKCQSLLDFPGRRARCDESGRFPDLS